MSRLVSVVIPVHNRAHLLTAALRSALAQRDVEVEVVVVDDGSTDDPGEVVAAVGDVRARVIRREERGGGSAARNSGIDAARGDVIAFLDSDDAWVPDKLAKQQEFLRSHPRTGLVVCGFVAVYPDGRRRIASPGLLRGEALHRLLMLSGGPLTTSMFLVEADVARMVRFDEALPALQDLDFALRVAQAGFRVGGVSDVLVHKNAETPGRVFSRVNEIRARQMLLQKYRVSLEQDPRRLARHHQALGLALSRAGNADAARAHLRSARKAAGDWGSRLLVPLAASPRLLSSSISVLGAVQDRDSSRIAMRLRAATRGGPEARVERSNRRSGEPESSRE